MAHERERCGPCECVLMCAGLLQMHRNMRCCAQRRTDVPPPSWEDFGPFERFERAARRARSAGSRYAVGRVALPLGGKNEKKPRASPSVAR